MTTKLAVFDCDGTLVDSQHSIIACMNASFERNGLPAPSDESVRRVVGLPLSEAMHILAPGISDDQAERLRAGYSEAWIGMRARGELTEPLFPGVAEVLAELEAAGWLLGVATGKSMRGLIGTLNLHGLEDRFVSLQTADRARGKPHPDMLIKAMDEAGAAVSSTVMIGDTTFDMQMARNAGVRAIGVSWGYHEKAELMETGAETVIADFSELKPFLETQREAAQ